MRTDSIQNSLNIAKHSQRESSMKGVQGGKELGKQDFLNLMMTQMANQDPMDPMDNKNMMAQLSAMGTLEQLQNLNSKIDKLMVIQEDIARAASTDLIGKDVELASQGLQLTSGSSAPISFALEGDANQVVIDITNEQGDLVRSISLSHHGPGSHHYNWDGLDNDGDRLADGLYHYNVIGKTKDGENLAVVQSKKGRVSDLGFESGRPTVKINGEWIRADKIKGIGTQSQRLFDGAVPLPLKTEVGTRKLEMKEKPLPAEIKLEN